MWRVCDEERRKHDSSQPASQTIEGTSEKETMNEAEDDDDDESIIEITLEASQVYFFQSSNSSTLRHHEGVWLCVCVWVPGMASKKSEGVSEPVLFCCLRPTSFCTNNRTNESSSSSMQSNATQCLFVRSRSLKLRHLQSLIFERSLFCSSKFFFFQNLISLANLQIELINFDDNDKEKAAKE